MPPPNFKDAYKLIKKASGRHSESEVFRSFCELSYCAIAKTTARTLQAADDLEARYMRVVAQYPKETIREVFPELLAMTAMNVYHSDFLGALAGEMGNLNAGMGQFFTPWEISLLMAQMTMGDIAAEVAKRGYLRIMEPACGAGAMILAAAHYARSCGVDVENQIWVQAVDLSELAFQMCYIQMSLASIPGKVIRGNSLSDEIFEVAYTPAALLFTPPPAASPFDGVRKRTRSKPKETL